MGDDEKGMMHIYNDGEYIYIETECEECDEAVVLAFSLEEIVPLIEGLAKNAKAVRAVRFADVQ